MRVGLTTVVRAIIRFWQAPAGAARGWRTKPSQANISRPSPGPGNGTRDSSKRPYPRRDTGLTPTRNGTARGSNRGNEEGGAPDRGRAGATSGGGAVPGNYMYPGASMPTYPGGGRPRSPECGAGRSPWTDVPEGSGAGDRTDTTPGTATGRRRGAQNGAMQHQLWC